MGNFVYWMNVSLDLKIEQTPGENGGGEWMRIDEELHTFFNEQAKALTMSVEGREIYEIMEEFWPTAREDESLPDFMREYGHIWTDTPKVLVSRSREHADYNTEIYGGDTAIDKLGILRAETAGRIGVGGATVATQLLNKGLLDELMLFTHPVILGQGRPLFDNFENFHGTISLDLMEQRSFRNGVTMHRYSLRYPLNI